VERIVRANGRIAVAGADEADGADGIGFEMLAEALVERKEGRLHGFHEEAVVLAGCGEDFLKLANVEGGGFFAEDVFAGGEGMEAKVGVGVGMGGDVDGLNVCVEQGFERWGNSGDGELLAVGLCAVGIAAPDGGEDGMLDRLKTDGEARGGAAGTDDAPAN
jgi:hypothetical protein